MMTDVLPVLSGIIGSFAGADGGHGPAPFIKIAVSIAGACVVMVVNVVGAVVVMPVAALVLKALSKLLLSAIQGHEDPSMNDPDVVVAPLQSPKPSLRPNTSKHAELPPFRSLLPCSDDCRVKEQGMVNLGQHVVQSTLPGKPLACTSTHCCNNTPECCKHILDVITN